VKANLVSVVLINTFDSHGGAAISALRLHRYYAINGVDSTFLCWRKVGEDQSVEQLVSHRLLWMIDTSIGRIVDAASFPYLGYASSSFLGHNKRVAAADVVHLHNLHGGYFSLRALRLFAGKRIVWTLHDMWAFTGNCSHSKDCERWLSGCGNCPYLDDYPKLRFDTTRFLWKHKKRIYEHLGISIVCPSRWLYEKAVRSPLFSNFQIHHIPNGIDVKVFSPMSKGEARRKLGLDSSGLFTIFVSNSLEDMRKGTDEFVTILKGIESEGVQLTVLLVGRGQFDSPSGFQHVKFRHVGNITSEAGMVDAYSAADFISFTSKAENLPSVLIESMACGTPAVSFNVGGVSEIIDHGKNGLIVENRDVNEFRQWVKTLASEPLQLRGMSEQAVAKVSRNFTIQMMAERYLQLYAAK
jgi:glycosyltransferase involved in cell wall biosynthesis